MRTTDLEMIHYRQTDRQTERSSKIDRVQSSAAMSVSV